MPSRIAPLAGLALGIVAASVFAQQTVQPPTTEPAKRPPNSVASPRDAQPYTNGSLTTLNPKLPTLFITGDSTAATGGPANNPNSIRGWAAILVDYFDTSKINLVNFAIGGTRFNTYLAPGRGGGSSPWDQVLAAVKPGDFVVIQFGQNNGPLAGVGDDTQEIPGRGGAAPSTMHSHGWYLRKMVNDVKAKGATPIPATLTIRDMWTADGKVERLKELAPGKGGMSDWTRQVAAQEKVPLVDHSNIIADMYDKMGETEADKLFQDQHLHTITAGAIINCEAFVEGLKGLNLAPINSALNDKGKALPTYTPPATK